MVEVSSPSLKSGLCVEEPATGLEWRRKLVRVRWSRWCAKELDGEHDEERTDKRTDETIDGEADERAN